MLRVLTHPLALGIVGVAVVAAVVITLAVRWAEQRRRRRAEGQHVGNDVARALTRDPALTGLGLHVTTRVDAMGHITLELGGEVPSPWYRYAARRTLERELRRRERDATIIDRIRVSSNGGQRRQA